jgi:hypothetical protein
MASSKAILVILLVVSPKDFFPSSDSTRMFTCNGRRDAYLFRNSILLASRLCKKAEATKEVEYNFCSRIWRLVTWKNLLIF